MMLRHLRGIGNKSRSALDKKLRPTAVLDVKDSGQFSIQDVATIGRAPDSHVVLNEHSVSRHHARIFYEAGRFWIKDLDSANGTALNGKKIKLQMLRDNDKITFGEAKAVFHASEESTGPASIGSDPLEGSDPLSQNGTPTGGLPATAHATAKDSSTRQLESELGAARNQPAAKDKEVESLLSKIEALRRENELLSKELEQKRGIGAGLPPTASTSASAGALERENERLRKLIKQLERALADTNLRLRNLQELLDRKRG